MGFTEVVEIGRSAWLDIKHDLDGQRPGVERRSYPAYSERDVAHPVFRSVL